VAASHASTYARPQIGPTQRVESGQTLCSQANTAPPPCIPSTIATPLNGHILRAFDISYVDPTIHTYVLAASATVGAGDYFC
jgi:hypothetical protein